MIDHKDRTHVCESDPRGGYVYVEVDVCHAHECPFWRAGKRHGPCNCGAEELREKWSKPAALGSALGAL